MSLPAIVTRLVGLWILAGAFLKLFQGSPADLPQVLRDLPLDTGLVFRLAISGELVVGLLAVLRPSRGWLPAKILTLAFLIILVTQVVGGEDSCGCFGAVMTISPMVMLIIDAIAFLALVVVKPWRLERDKAELPWAATALVILGCLVLPWVIDNQTTTADVAAGNTDGNQWVELKWDTWKDKALKDTEIWPLLQPRAQIDEGLIILWSPTCEVCEEHLMTLHGTQQGQQPVVLLELPLDFDDEKIVVKVLPKGAYVVSYKLPKATYVDVTPPLHVEIEDGKVKAVYQGMDARDHALQPAGAPHDDDDK